MKNILVLVGEYKPYSSTNGNIADNIIQEFKKYGYNVSVLARKNVANLESVQTIDDVKIYRNRDLNLIIHDYCLKMIKRGKKIFKLILFIKRVIFFLPKIFRKNSISKHYTRKIEKSIKKIHEERKIDIVIPVSAPHEEVFAAMNFKKENNDIKLIVYQLDQFANADTIYPLKALKSRQKINNMQLEIELLSWCNNLFALKPVYEYYYTNLVFEKYFKKIILTEHPLIKNLNLENKKESSTINLLYAGALYSQLRNPSYLLKIFDSSIMKKSNIKLHMYSFGDCQSIIEKYAKKMKHTIYNHEKIPHEMIIKKMREADILLSIGNNSKNEVPSKLFEYLSFRKPIIHLYYNDEDVYLKYLKNYQYSICIKMDKNNIERNSKVFYNFCKENKNINISFDIIERNFKEATPEYVAKQFINKME